MKKSLYFLILSIFFIQSICGTVSAKSHKHSDSTTRSEPQRDIPDNPTGTIVLCVFVLGAVALYIYLRAREAKKAQERVERMKVEAEEFITRVKTQGMIDSPSTSVLLKKGEFFFG